MDERYLVVENTCGKGVFSNVVKAKDQVDKENGMVAIKVMRANDMMKKAAEKEIEILQLLNNADKGNKRHVIRLLSTFYYRKHLCLVFECMWDDLREAVKKYTKGKGMALTAVRAYAKQLVVGVRHMHRCKIIHADIKPDNILISEGHNIVKFCDLFTGKILFRGKTNNDQLRRIMEIKGKIPGKLIKKGMLWKNHFDENLDFKFEDSDKGTGETITRTLSDLSAKKHLKDLIMERVGPEKRASATKEDQQYVRRALEFADLLEQMLAIDPDKRISPNDALNHPFLTDFGAEKAAAEAAKE